MFWDIFTGVLLAIVLFVLISVTLTTLVRLFDGMLRRLQAAKPGLIRTELIPRLARFGAVALIALIVSLLLLAQFG